MISKLKQINWKSRNALSAALILMLSLLVLWVLLSYLMEDNNTNDQSPESLFQLFQSPSYKKLIARLDKNNRTVLTGRLEYGLNVFINYYVQRSGVSEVRRRSLDKGPLEFDISPAAGAFAEFFHRHITSRLWVGDGGGIWILDNGRSELSRVDLTAIQRLMEEHPNDRFIVVNYPTYQQLKGFKVLNYHQPSEQSLMEMLQSVGFDSKPLQKLVLRYTQGSVHELSKLLSSYFPKGEFVGLFESSTSKIREAVASMGSKSSSLVKLLKYLCKEGYVPSSNYLKGLGDTKVIANFEEDGYYWADYHYYFGYSIGWQADCRYPEQISSYIAQPAPEPTPEPQPSETEAAAEPKKSKKAAKSKKK